MRSGALVSGNESTSTGRQWDHALPPVLVPVAAVDLAGELTGKRVILHSDTAGFWVCDLRAVGEAHVIAVRWSAQPPGTDPEPAAVVPVLAEGDYYRRLRDQAANQAQTEVTEPYLVPVDRLWVEVPMDSAGTGPVIPDQRDIGELHQTPALIEDVTKPPVKWPLSAPRLRRLAGSRALLMQPTGPCYDLRVLGEPRRADPPQGMLNLQRGLDSIGEPFMITMAPVCSEAEYYRFLQTGWWPRDVVEVDTSLLWVV